MIAKGVAHRDGAVLARYLVTGREGERAELWQLRGFASTGIVAAFRSVHVMAAATRCLAPFFHVCVRNRDTERLDRWQWEDAANSIERVLGLTDQPRAIALHTAHATGDAHIHIAWSRINEQTLTAKPLPFFKQRLKQVCRELETRFGLAPVPSQREGPIRFAPTRPEEEQARRLGVDLHATREKIRICFERSDCGRSFRDALVQERLLLARGDRRDFLIVDGAGAMYALAKRILGVSAAEIRDRLADLRPDHLPTLQQARDFVTAAKQRSLGNQLDHSCRPAGEAPKAVGERERRRSGPAEKNTRAAGKEWRGDRVTTHLITHCASVPHDHLITEPSVPEAQSNTTEITEIPRTNYKLQVRLGEPSSPDPNIGREPATGLSDLEQIPRPSSQPGHLAQFRDQLRAVVKQLTAKVLHPGPATRKRRREEITGGFRKAALGLLRRIAQFPPLHFLDPAWEPFTWLRLWEYNSPASMDFHQDCSISPPPEDLSLRL